MKRSRKIFSPAITLAEETSVNHKWAFGTQIREDAMSQGYSSLRNKTQKKSVTLPHLFLSIFLSLYSSHFDWHSSCLFHLPFLSLSLSSFSPLSSSTLLFPSSGLFFFLLSPWWALMKIITLAHSSFFSCSHSPIHCFDPHSTKWSHGSKRWGLCCSDTTW